MEAYEFHCVGVCQDELFVLQTADLLPSMALEPTITPDMLKIRVEGLGLLRNGFP